MQVHIKAQQPTSRPEVRSGILYTTTRLGLILFDTREALLLHQICLIPVIPVDQALLYGVVVNQERFLMTCSACGCAIMHVWRACMHACMHALLSCELNQLIVICSIAMAAV